MDEPWGGLGGRVKRAFGVSGWQVEPFGPDGRALTHIASATTIIATRARHHGDEWLHASVAHPDRMPTWQEMRWLKEAVFGERFAYMVFPPSSTFVNIHDYALHLWGRDDGAPAIPDFVGDWLAQTGELSL